MNLIPKVFAQFSDIGTKATEISGKSQSGVFELFATLWNNVGGWIAGLIVILISFIIAKIVRKMVVNKVGAKLAEENKDILTLTGRATYAGVLALGFTIGFNVAGIDLTAILAAAGFAIGFALRDLIMNFLSGVLILLSRQFHIGDTIKVGENTGKVEEIQSRATILKGFDGTKIIVPNKDLFTKDVISYTTNPFRRIEIPLSVAYGTDLHLAIESILNVISLHTQILKEPASGVVIDSFNSSGIDLKVRFWVESKSSWGKIKGQLISEIQNNFDQKGISIPFPIQTVLHQEDLDNMKKQRLLSVQNSQDTTSSIPVLKPAVPVIPSPVLPAQKPASMEPEIKITSDPSTLPVPSISQKKDTGSNFLSQ